MNDNVEFIEAFITDKDGTKEMTWGEVRGEGSGPPSLIRRGVKTRRLDSIIDKCDLIKIDVEGHSLYVLREAEELINNYQPVILLEVHSRKMSKNELNQLNDLIRIHDYNIIDVSNGNKMERLDRSASIYHVKLIP